MERKHNKALVSRAKELRKNMTKEERHLWYDFLRDYPVRFYRQKVLGNCIVDFCCAEAKLIIELDGSQHYDTEGRRRDEDRTAVLEKYSYAVLRIPNNAVMENFDGVCEHIDRVVQERRSG